MIKLNAAQLRKLTKRQLKSKLKKQEIYVVLDNVLDTYNIGSAFRLCDALACKKLYLCGGTVTPPNHRIKKASINTTEWVDWEYYTSAVEVIAKLKTQISNLSVVAIEQDTRSISYERFEYKMPICLVVGHETEGVSKEVLDMCDAIVELPMFGVNISLNVIVSLAVVLYQVIQGKMSKNQAAD